MTLCEDCGAVFADIVTKCPVCEVPGPDANADAVYSNGKFKAGAFIGYKNHNVDRHPSVRSAVGRLLYKALIDQALMEEADDEDELDDYIKSLSDAYLGYDDAYDVAKSLDRNGWSVSMQLVTVVDDFSSTWYQIKTEARKQMVIDNAIAVPFAVGDKVTTRGGHGVVGEVVGIIADEAKVKVHYYGDVDGRNRIYCVEQVERKD